MVSIIFYDIDDKKIQIIYSKEGIITVLLIYVLQEAGWRKRE